MSDDTDDPTEPNLTVTMDADTDDLVEALQRAQEELHRTREAAEALADALEEVDEAGDIDVKIDTGEAFTSSLSEHNFRE